MVKKFKLIGEHFEISEVWLKADESGAFPAELVYPTVHPDSRTPQEPNADGDHPPLKFHTVRYVKVDGADEYRFQP